MKSAIIFGSSRYDGNTSRLVNQVRSVLDASLFELKDYDITPFDYQHQNKNDDYLKLVRELVKHDHLVFATPVYWYSMSAQLKIFFDRFSDLLIIEKDLGRRLRGLSCSVIATGSDDSLPECFEQAFKLAFEYLGMYYKGVIYCSCTGGSQMNLPSKERINEIIT